MELNDHSHQAGKNFIWLSFAQVMVRIMGAAFYFLLSFKLMASGLGQYNFVASFVPLWFLFLDFGASTYLYRQWSKQTQSKEEVERDFTALFSFTLAIVSLLFLVFFSVNFFINRQLLAPLVLFFIVMYISGYIHWLDSYLQANNLFRQPALRQIIEKFSAVAFGVVLVLWRPTVSMVFVALVGSQIVSFLYYYLFYKNILIRVRLMFDFQRAKQLFFAGLPFVFIGVFSTIYSKIDLTMLRYMQNFTVVGWYGSAYKFLDISTIFSSLFTAAIFPILSSLYARQAPEMEAFLNKALRIIFTSGILIAVAFIFLAPLFFRLFFPASFSPGILVLRILIMAQVLIFFSLLFNNFLLIQNKEKFSLYIIIVSALVNVVLNWYLIPKYGMYGSAWATVIAEAGNLLMLQYFVQWKRNLPMLWKMAAVLFANLALLLFIRKIGLLNNLVLGAFMLLANLVLLWLAGFLQKEDITMFLQPLKVKLASLWPNPE